MRVYLDNSVLNRPFDDQSIPKNRLEAVATIFIFKLIEQRKIKLMNSSVIEYENFKNPFPERRFWISAYLSKASFYQKLDIRIERRAKEIEKFKITAVDSLHLATAEKVRVDYFITCDYEVIKRYIGDLKIVNPIDFIQSFNLRSLWR